MAKAPTVESERPGHDLPGFWGAWGIHQAVPWALILATFLAVGIAWVYLKRINLDVAVSLSMAERCADGEKLYVDMTEINPPLFVWVATPPVLVARALDWPVIPVFNAWIIALLLGCLTLTWRVMAAGAVLPNKVMRRGFLLAAAFCLFSFSLDDFAQRDFMMVALFLPYLMLAVARAMHRRLDWKLCLLVGLVGGVGLSYKPFFLAPLLAIEAYLTFGRKAGWFWRRPELLTVIGVHLLFVVLWATPAYLNMLRIASKVYGAYDSTLGDILFGVVVLAPTAYGALAAAAVIKATPDTRELRRILALVVAAWIVIIFVQHKGFTYHFYPARTGGVLLLTVIGLALARGPAGRRLFRPGMVATALVALLLGDLGLAVRKAWNPPADYLQMMVPVTAKYAKDKPMMFLSSSVWPAFPLYNYSGAKWVSRFGCLWMLPGYYRTDEPRPEGGLNPALYHSREEMDEGEKWQLDTLVDDLERTKPALVIVEVAQPKQAFGYTNFNFLEYFQRDARFRALWASLAYQRMGNLGPYEFWIRTAGPNPPSVPQQ